ncbi:unnamed protein product [Rotaria sp. Silwood2]|nr:unnamed protein product [Rotaria sp. Silwood2]CAF2899809.1 unnamed protein product [Rotaria sp. Silwood2]CAF3203312.1 unnamed protein product [Rotaria sp. Silwood2]CAF3349913.1 unnamed protein product [Rotaria sp. Silwood2]CAF4238357.1 unnamed protein product [Rotaria sp. Silwood2]
MGDAIKSIQTKTHPSHSFPPLYGSSDEPSHYINLLDMTKRVLSAPGIDQNNLALINFDSITDGTGLRSRIWSDMCNSDKPVSFVKCIKKPHGVHIFRIIRIYERNRHYPFWISPRGNGIDCHRTWEALYLDIIPIVWNSTLNSLYKNLPIVIINNHTDLTESFLRDQLQEIAMKKKAQSNSSSSSDGYQYERLRNAFWRRMILSKSRYATKILDLTHQRRCWRAKSSWLEWARYVPFLKYT